MLDQGSPYMRIREDASQYEDTLLGTVTLVRSFEDDVRDRMAVIHP